MKKIKAKKSLSEKALLVVVSISQWSGRKIDKKATETANVAHKASQQAGRYHKALLPGAEELSNISALASQARTYFYEQTLPWMNDGSRIISGKNYLRFAGEMQKIKAEFESSVKAFVAAYPKLKAEAVQKLGELYDAEEYPEDISSKFSLEVSFLPLPDVKDFRTEISDAEKKAFIAKMKETELKATQECFNRLHTVVKNAAEKLKKPDAIFRDNLIENIKEMVSLLPMLNVSDSSQLEKIRKEVSELVGEIDVKEIRQDSKKRDVASKALSDIEAKMGAFMGRK